MARWREKREMGQEGEQQLGNSAVSPTTEQWHSTWSCKCAQEYEQSQSARQCCQKLLRDTSPPPCQGWEAALQIQLAPALACSLAEHFQQSWHGLCAWGCPSSSKGNASLDTCADPPVSGHPRKLCWAIFHTLPPAKKRFQDKIP